MILAFGAGAAASTWLHLKAKRRRSPTPPPPPEHAAPLCGLSRAAVIIMTLPPEVSVGLFDQMGPEEVQRVSLHITRLPMLTPARRERIVSEFCSSVGVAPDRLGEAAREEPGLIARALVTLSHLPPAAQS